MKNIDPSLFSQRKILFFLFVFFITNVCSAQVAVTSATTIYSSSTKDTTYTANGAINSPDYSNTYTYDFGTYSGAANNDLALESFIAGGVSYTFQNISNMYVKLRRQDNPIVKGTRNLKWTEGSITNSTVNVAASYNADMESFFAGNKNFNSGTDNIFGNRSDGNGDNNDIERLDVIFPTGIVASDNSQLGFAVFERGANSHHDPVKVAAILALGADSMPILYSSVIEVTPASYGAADIVANTNYVIIRSDTAIDPLTIATNTNQAIGGVFFKYSDLNIPNNTPIYGYSLIPDDFPGSADSTNIVDYTDTIYFPHNTNSVTDSAGGIDPVAFTGILTSSNVILPIHLISFYVNKNNDLATLHWVISNEINTKGYEVERSVNSIGFSAIATIAAKESIAAVINYSYTDTVDSTNAAAIYYRIKVMNEDGSYTYSKIISIENLKIAGIKIFPEPVQSSFTISNTDNGIYNISLVSTDGKQLYRWNNVAIDQQRIFNINRSSIARGIYCLKIINIQNNKTADIKILLQ